VFKRVSRRWLLFRTYRQRNEILNKKAMNAEKWRMNAFESLKKAQRPHGNPCRMVGACVRMDID
jgi:hypothetical protein